MKVLSFIFLNLFHLPNKLNSRFMNLNSIIHYDEVFDIFENVRTYSIQSQLIMCNKDADCPAPYKCCNNPIISNFTDFCCIDNRGKLKVDYI
jgi:hypothetical protein